MNKLKVAVVIPCYNEEAGIAKVVGGFNREHLLYHGYELDIIVVDNNSTDSTAAVAQKAGARVITERIKGKGNAMRTGFKNVSDDTSYVVMLDGDFTYSPAEIGRMQQLLRCSHRVPSCRQNERRLHDDIESSRQLDLLSPSTLLLPC